MEVRFDWLTFTVQNDVSELEILLCDLFELDFELFTPCRGRYGYSKGYFYENITILTEGGCENMGICFDISGKGCTYLYSLDTFDFENLFKKINSLGGNITRLDTALDCFNNELDYQNIIDAVANHNYSSRWRNVKVITSYSKDGIGFDAQFGSRSSDIMLRIYDKKVESGCSDKEYWCRLELQCRKDLAHSFADTFLNRDDDYDYIELFLGVLCHYLRFIDRIYENSPNKCPTLPWWEEFIMGCRKCVILRHDNYVSYTLDQLVYNVKTRFSQSYKVFIDLFGEDALLDVLANAEVKSRNYKSLLNHYQKFKEQHELVDMSFLYKN